MSEGQKQAATKRKRAKKQGVGGKPTVVKAMKDKKPFADYIVTQWLLNPDAINKFIS